MKDSEICYDDEGLGMGSVELGHDLCYRAHRESFVERGKDTDQGETEIENVEHASGCRGWIPPPSPLHPFGLDLYLSFRPYLSSLLTMMIFCTVLERRIVRGHQVWVGLCRGPTRCPLREPRRTRIQASRDEGNLSRRK